MSIDTYSDLKTRLADWISRSDLSTQIDDAIEMFESEIVDVLPSRQSLTSTALTTTPGTRELTLGGLFDLVSVKFGTSSLPLLQMSENAAAQMYGDLRGEPKAFSYSGNGSTLKLWPRPDGAYSVTVEYLADLVPLTSNNPTNWLLTKKPNIYLYGVLRHLATYVEDAERKASIEPSYLAFVNAFLRAEVRRRLAGGQRRHKYGVSELW